jgi:hypothetical protein
MALQSVFVVSTRLMACAGAVPTVRIAASAAAIGRIVRAGKIVCLMGLSKAGV